MLQKGWTQLRVNGSHHILVKEDEVRVVSIPVHGNKSLKTGTQKAIMKSAGLTEKDL